MQFLSVNIESKTFTSTGANLDVLGELAFRVEPGEIVSIIGPSGCGKTTLLRIIAGLETEYVGSVTLGGDPLEAPSRRCGFVFQDSRLLPWKRLVDNLKFALPRDMVPEEKNLHADLWLDRIGLSEFHRAWPHELSGGMQQRVALARALMTKPHVLLMDEPFSSLDYASRRSARKLVSDLVLLERPATVIVTHDIDDAIALSTRIISLSSRPSRVIAEFSGFGGAAASSEALVKLRHEIETALSGAGQPKFKRVD